MNCCNVILIGKFSCLNFLYNSLSNEVNLVIILILNFLELLIHEIR